MDGVAVTSLMAFGMDGYMGRAPVVKWPCEERGGGGM